MSCYAEFDYISEDRREVVLVQFDNSDERDYVLAKFLDTALPSERVRPITRHEARRDYAIEHFGRYPYRKIFVMANPDRPDESWRFEALEPTAVFKARMSGWQSGSGTGVQMSLMGGE